MTSVLIYHVVGKPEMGEVLRDRDGGGDDSGDRGVAGKRKRAKFHNNDNGFIDDSSLRFGQCLKAPVVDRFRGRSGKSSNTDSAVSNSKRDDVPFKEVSVGAENGNSLGERDYRQ
ncbi:hypothetical protein ACOSQ3_021040 [Xanthoceras sorbifolium]